MEPCRIHHSSKFLNLLCSIIKLIHVVVYFNHVFFLLLSNVLLYVWIRFLLGFLLPHSPLHGLLGYFQFWTIINKVIMTTCVQVSTPGEGRTGRKVLKAMEKQKPTRERTSFLKKINPLVQYLHCFLMYWHPAELHSPFTVTVSHQQGHLIHIAMTRLCRNRRHSS